jgi:hypothetical protein
MRTLTLLMLASTAMASANIGSAKTAACSFSDLSLTIGSTTYNPTKCVDNVAQGGGTTTETIALDNGIGLNGSFLASSAGSATADQGILFTVTASGDSDGVWHVSWSDNNGPLLLNLPITLSLEIGLFGGNNGSGYLLSNVLLPSSPTSGSGTFDIDFLNHGDEPPDLSHLILAGYNLREASSPVPEPMSMALLGVGLIGLSTLRQRRQQRA